MSLSYLIVVLLAVIQGAAELLPVSSSAHVIVAERLLHLDPSTPEMAFLLVMLHTGTMGAVLVYFWSRWKARLQDQSFLEFAKMVVIATIATGILGLVLKTVIEHIVGGDLESIFKNLYLIAAALLAAGVIILAASPYDTGEGVQKLDMAPVVRMGLIQGLCLPFRGFSRSGATISIGLMSGLSRALAEDFSFALAVALTPAVIVYEGYRLLKTAHASGIELHLGQLLAPGLVGMVCSFGAGLIALRLLSDWLENGKWKFFGYYCLVAACAIFAVALHLSPTEG
jgi:undecaprenyl-diphosphatase